MADPLNFRKVLVKVWGFLPKLVAFEVRIDLSKARVFGEYCL